MKDEQSLRGLIGHSCTGLAGGRWETEEVCDFSEECLDDGGPACVNCGARATRRASRTVDGTLVEDCEGCRCSYWALYGCYAESAIGQPIADIGWQRDFDVLRMVITPSGDVLTTGGEPLPGATLVNPTVQIVPNGVVEFDIVIDQTVTDSFGIPHAWHLEAHVYATCPAT